MAFSNQIAGEYTGNLSNDGELITMVDASGTTIHSFTYNDQLPWPEGPDGDGFTLVLIDPSQQPVLEHAAPASWRASGTVGGSPGESNSSTYESWRIANGLPIPEIDPDPDKDERDNLLEYFEGTDPNTSDYSLGTVNVETLIVGGFADEYIIFRFRRNLMAEDVTMIPQVSDDLESWLQGAANIVLHGRERLDDFHETVIFRSTAPSGNQRLKFGRLQLELQR